LERQRRIAQYRFQEEYLEHLREQERRLREERHDFYNDPYFYTAPVYRYHRGGRYYETNQYGADLLRQAVNYGYEEGFRAAVADREDHWRPDYRSSYAYRDATYGYSGYYLDPDDYRYFFREGFRRGYEDGYNERYEYGYESDGSYGVLAEVLSRVLNLQPLS
jgi:flagellar biosynthesis/type III secretory pathway protein FliH